MAFAATVAAPEAARAAAAMVLQVQVAAAAIGVAVAATVATREVHKAGVAPQTTHYQVFRARLPCKHRHSDD